MRFSFGRRRVSDREEVQRVRDRRDVRDRRRSERRVQEAMVPIERRDGTDRRKTVAGKWVDRRTGFDRRLSDFGQALREISEFDIVD